MPRVFLPELPMTFADLGHEPAGLSAIAADVLGGEATPGDGFEPVFMDAAASIPGAADLARELGAPLAASATAAATVHADSDPDLGRKMGAWRKSVDAALAKLVGHFERADPAIEPVAPTPPGPEGHPAAPPGGGLSCDVTCAVQGPPDKRPQRK